MHAKMMRRDFLKATAAGCATCLGAGRLFSDTPAPKGPGLLSPGSRKSKVRVAKIYMGIPRAMWPTPKMELEAEVQRYDAEIGRMKKEFSDIDFVVSELVTQRGQLDRFKDALKDVDGILAIHLSMGAMDILGGVLAARRPTLLFAAPYSGHEWTGFGSARRGESGALLECMLSSDLRDLAAAVRPFRAIHHLREAKVLDLTTSTLSPDYLKAVSAKFGTEIKRIELDHMLALYESVDAKAAKAEAERWTKGAEKVVEPDQEEIFKSARLALAFEKFLDEEQATVMTVDCYGSMYRKLPAFPCMGNVRLNDMGLGGICESDLSCAMSHIILQGLTGRPGFISDPTMDESKKAIILAHCLGSTRMDGPDGEAAPYKLRTIMERQEGCVPQVRMRVGQKVTQIILTGTDTIRYFTGEVIEAPDVDRGCRTKITVRIDGDAEKLWQNWSHGLHRQTVYGDILPDLKRFARYKGISLVNEAV